MSVGSAIVYENWLSGTWANAEVMKIYDVNGYPQADIKLEDGTEITGVDLDSLDAGATGEGLVHSVEGVKLG